MIGGQEAETQAELEERAIGDLDEAVINDIIQEHTESTWDMPDDVPGQSAILNGTELINQKIITRELHVEEEHVVEEHSPSHHRKFDPDSYFVDASVDERHEIVPSEFIEDTLRFFIPGSEEQSNCSKCSSRGRLVCNKCEGQGNVRCRSCSGTGTKSDSDGNVIKCKKCSGNGNKPCRSCNGTGDISCGRCDGTGQTVKFEYISREFIPEETTEVITESVPEPFLAEAKGSHKYTEELPLEEDLVRHEREVREIPVKMVEYQYGGSEYEVFEIEHEIQAESHPRDLKQWTKVLVGFAALTAVIAITYLYVL